MKKTIVSLLAVLACTAAFAQNDLPTTDNGDQTTKPVIPLIVGDYGDYIHVDSLQYLATEFTVKKNSKLLEGYEVTGLTMVFIPEGNKVVKVVTLTGNKLDAASKAFLRTMKPGDKLVLDNIKLKNPASGETANGMPVVHTIINSDTRLHLNAGSHTVNLTLKGLKLLDETITLSEDSCELKSFTITIASDNIKPVSYNLKGNKLTPEILAEIKSLPASSKIMIENVTVLTNNNTYRNIGPTTYTISQ